MIYIQRAIRDILDNRFLNAVTMVTIALSVLIVSAFGLFFINAQDLFNAWKKGVRIMVYLGPDTSEAQRLDTRYRLQGIAGIQSIRFISKDEALMLMKERMPRQISLLDNLKENPLPDGFEVTLVTASNSPENIEFLAQRIEGLSSVADVEYGRQWIERFANFFNLFKLAGYGLGSLFFMATVFITANTIRLVLYARREEIHIMRLVGATDNFVKVPFYLEGLLQGFWGSLVGLAILYAVFATLGSQFEQTLSAEMVAVRFFSIGICAAIVGGGMMTGLLGCFFSLGQFLKT
ncbi:MAG: permease-like cell division protein FtsX [Desulfosarcina sp.]